MNSYVSLLVMIAAAAALLIGGLVMNSFLGPKRHNRVKLENYECGVEATPAASGRGHFPIKCYLTAMMLIILGIEIVLLYPWAISFCKLGLFGVVVMPSFVFLTTTPFVYEWRRGGFEWG